MSDPLFSSGSLRRALSGAWTSRSSRSRSRKVALGLAGVVGAVLVTAAPAAAQELSPAEYNTALLASLWLIVAGCLVFLMQAGFALVEAGLTRAKNVGNIMAKNLADMAIGALAFWAVGFGFAFGSDGGSLIGTDAFFLSGMTESFDSGDVLATPSFFFFLLFLFFFLLLLLLLLLSSSFFSSRKPGGGTDCVWYGGTLI